MIIPQGTQAVKKRSGYDTLDTHHKKIDEVMEDIYASASY